MSASAWLRRLSASSSDASAGRGSDTRRSASSSIRSAAGGLRRAAAVLLLCLPLLLGFAAGVQAQTPKSMEFLGFKVDRPSGSVDSGFDGTYEVNEGKILYGKVRMHNGSGLAGVGIRVKSGTATPGQDYGNIGRANIPSGSTTGWFGIRIKDDAIADDTETIMLEFYEVTVQGGFVKSDGTIRTPDGGHGTAEITIRDWTSTDPADQWHFFSQKTHLTFSSPREVVV